MQRCKEKRWDLLAVVFSPDSLRHRLSSASREVAPGGPVVATSGLNFYLNDKNKGGTALAKKAVSNFPR